MRPKKKVLLYCQDEERLSRTAFVLWSKSYSVTTMSDPLSIFQVLRDWNGDCAVVMESSESDECQDLVSELRNALPDVKVLTVYQAEPQRVPSSHAIFVGGDVAELLSRVKVLCARKRGPTALGIWNYDEVTA